MQDLPLFFFCGLLFLNQGEQKKRRNAAKTTTQIEKRKIANKEKKRERENAKASGRVSLPVNLHNSAKGLQRSPFFCVCVYLRVQWELHKQRKKKMQAVLFVWLSIVAYEKVEESKGISEEYIQFASKTQSEPKQEQREVHESSLSSILR
jgi:hypothetical protein